MRVQLRVLLVLVFCSVVVFSCQRNSTDEPMEGPIVLVWNKSDSETRSEMETGLKWYFSMLGAELSKESWDAGLTWVSNVHVVVEPDKLGFNEHAQEQLRLLWAAFRETEEFGENGAVDMGRFVASTLNNSNHYYKIVDMPEDYAAFKAGNSFANHQAAINPSSVSFGYRKILFPASDQQSMAFISEEYAADFTQSQAEPEEIEVLDVMPNGQLRFGVYENGHLRSGADEVFSIGGKPSKCMWCHESKFLPNFSNSTDFSGYLTTAQFNETIEEHNDDLTSLRAQLDPFLDYSKTKEHIEMELLYIRYFEPSAQRLANEWGVSESEVESLLSNLSTHVHHEFPELGPLYFRHQVETHAPFMSLESPTEMRETENTQPDYL